MKWTRKALIQRTLSRTPKGETIYQWGQQHFGRLKNYKVHGKVRAARRMLKGLHEVGMGLENKRTIEIGTGPIPIVPLFFWLHGQAECVTYDVSTLLRPSLILEAAKQLAAFPSTDMVRPSKLFEEYDVKRQSLIQLLEEKVDASSLLQHCKIEYKAPVDFCGSDQPSQSFDIIYSNTVLEHIPKQVLHMMFAESSRLLRRGACMLHVIDLSDHFSHTDKAISSINFLQYSEQSYSKYQSSFLYQNRLREPFWRQLFLDHGFELTHWQKNINERAIKDMGSLDIHKDFSQFTPDEICTSSICVVGKKR